MRLLLDQNLSRNLVRHLRETYPETVHVSAVGLEGATDRGIWDFAGQNGYLIVSKDSDFRQLAFMLGPPPKVIWLRVGNVSTAGVLQIPLDHQEAIDAFEDSEEEALLVLPALPRS